MRLRALMFFLLTCPCFSAAPVTYTVCAAGCSFVDYLSATGTATATDFIRFNEVYTGPLTVNTNFAGIIIPTGVTMTAASGMTVITVSTGVTQPFPFPAC